MIGYYVHHHGSGHLNSAQILADTLADDVVVLSSLPEPDGPTPFADWIALPRDDDGDRPVLDRRANGALHWAPIGHAGHRARLATLAAWVQRAAPRVVVVDISVEVTTLCRLLGVPTVVMTLPGDRTDAPHELAHRAATRIVAPWPRELYDPAHLHPHRDRVAYVGAFSRFDAAPVPVHAGGPRTVLALLGRGGTDVSAAELAAAAAATPGWHWRVAGGDTWTDDVWAALHAADVVVTHAGCHAVAEVAAARRPAVLVPQDRPFAEQHAVAAALTAAGVAPAASRWPGPAGWSALLEDAVRRGGAEWKRWNTGDGAARAAAVIEAAAAIGAAA